MATTGFWPVKGRLKDVITYADNPEKTGGLRNALEYASDGDKTDECFFVTALNCPKQKVYESMTATKRHFGKLGGNVAYHGYQSFRKDEVTPDEALAIGRETARRMWGDKYEVLIAVHGNTDNIHCHFVINSVSFRTGEKYRNKIADHIKLREISDAVCLEYGKSVMKDAPFRKGEKNAYWVKKNGTMTHMDILKEDMELCLNEAYSVKDLIRRMDAIGYECDFIPKHAHWTVKAADWERPVRIDRLGFTKERLKRELDGHKLNGYGTFNQTGFYLLSHPIYKPKYYPVNSFFRETEYELNNTSSIGVIAAVPLVILFAILLEIMQLASQQKDYRPQTPGLRKLITEAHDIKLEYQLLTDNNISSVQELFDFRDKTESNITVLETERQWIRNKIRRCASDEEKNELKRQAKEITKQINPLRKQNKIADRIEKRTPELLKMLICERELEIRSIKKQKNLNYERSR